MIFLAATVVASGIASFCIAKLIKSVFCSELTDSTPQLLKEEEEGEKKQELLEEGLESAGDKKPESDKESLQLIKEELEWTEVVVGASSELLGEWEEIICATF